MAIISQETWDNMPSEEKEKLCRNYSENYDAETRAILDDIFDKENLRQIKRPKIWDDMEELHEDVDTAFVELEESLANIDCETKLFNKILATYQIRQLIELGYGGAVTAEEWANNHILKFCVDVAHGSQYDKLVTYDSDDDYRFIAFHTAAQRKEFMSYSSNRKLVQQYYEF